MTIFDNFSIFNSWRLSNLNFNFFNNFRFKNCFNRVSSLFNFNVQNNAFDTFTKHSTSDTLTTQPSTILKDDLVLAYTIQQPKTTRINEPAKVSNNITTSNSKPQKPKTTQEILAEAATTAKNKIKEVARPVVKFARNALETFSYLKSIGYNEKAGKKLAKTALSNTNGRRKSTHMCAKGVKTAIQNSGLGKYQTGHAYAIPSILASNPNFKEVPVSSVDWRNLPSGCVKWYAPGSAGYSKRYGHVSITGENPKEEISDFIAKVNPNRKPDKIFIPV